jgi:ribonuclease J
MSDSTNVEREGCTVSEERIYHSFKDLVTDAKGLTLIAMFASNVGRMGQVIEIAQKLGKRVALLGRGMEQNAKHGYDLGYLEGLYDVLIPVDDVGVGVDRKDCIVLSTGSQGEYRSGLVRVANNEHKGLKLLPGDTVIMSSRFIPGNEKPISRMINQLFRSGADVIYDSAAQVHVSGHASSQELALMMEYTKPEFFVPVHGEYRHLVKHKRLALKNGVQEGKAVIAVNGDVLELSANGLSLVEHFDENRIMIEGATGDDVDKVTIKDRRKVAETGIVFAIIVRNSVSGDIMAGPDIMSRGFLEENKRNDLIDDAKVTMMDTVETMFKSGRRDAAELQEEVRVALRRFFNNRLGKKPVVLVILVDV